MSDKCGYCEGEHTSEKCVFVFRPIKDCEHVDPVDGLCIYPGAPTPECHVTACPRLDLRCRTLGDVQDAQK